MIKQTVFPFSPDKPDYFAGIVIVVSSIVLLYTLKKQRERLEIFYSEKHNSHERNNN